MNRIRKNISEYSFLFVAFVWGWAALYGSVMSFLLILLTIFNIRSDHQTFLRNWKESKYYLVIPAAFTVYMLLHFLVARLLGAYGGMKASFGIFETMLLYFIAIPLYVLSMKPRMTAKLLGKALGLFCCGVFLFNLGILFHLSGWDIFVRPLETLDSMYLIRFGDNMNLWGSHMMLEPRAMVLALASLIAFFLLLIKRRWWIGILTLVLLLFLSMTLTKASFLAFLFGAITACVYMFTKVPKRPRLLTLLAIGLTVILAVEFVPEGVSLRFQDTAAELEAIQDGRLEGGSLAPRIAMWKNVSEHFNEYALWGVGVYFKPVLREWYASDSTLIWTNVHNSFLEYWIKGGILGLVLIISVFAFPLLRMQRQKQWSLLALGMIIIVCIAANTCVLFVHAYSLGIIMFWLSICYFYLKEFIALEQAP